MNKTYNVQMMTKYEKSKIIGERALQLSKGAPTDIDPVGETNPLRIAQMELRARKMPLKIRRPYPDGSYEVISVNNLIVE